MSTFQLKIETGNAAFEEDGKSQELARILRNLAERLEGGEMPDNDGWNLRDLNGNTVGNVSDDSDDSDE